MRPAFSLVLDCLKCEVVKFDLSGTQLFGIFQNAAVEAGTSGDLPDRPTNTKHTESWPCLSAMIALHLTERQPFSLRLPVLVDEALILCVRINGRQGRGHVPVDLHHFVMQERGDVKILLQDLLPG